MDRISSKLKSSKKAKPWFFNLYLAVILATWPVATNVSLRLGFANPGLSSIFIMAIIYLLPIIFIRRRIIFPLKDLIVFYLSINIFLLLFAYQDGSLKLFFQLLMCIIFYIIMTNKIRTTAQYSTLMKWVICLASVVMAIWCFRYLFVFHNLVLTPYWDGTSQSEMGKNTLGAFLTIIYPFVYGLVIYRKITPIIGLPVILIMTFSALYVVSRASLIGLVLVILLMFLFSRWKDKWRHFSVLLFCLLVSISITFFFKSSPLALFLSFDKGAKTFFLESHDTSIGETSRVRLLRRGVLGFLEQPIFGHGLGSYTNRFGEDPHNDYTRLLFETGIMGTFLFFALILTVIRRLLKIRQTIASEHYWLLEAQLIALPIALLSSLVNDLSHTLMWWLLISGGQILYYDNIPAKSERITTPVTEVDQPTS